MIEEQLREFRTLLYDSFRRLRGITEAAASPPIAPGKWSRKQILGHLIDSASNNHQRFVRGQLDGDVFRDLSFPGYEQDRWVEAQHYAETDWQDLLLLWISYNLHLLRVASAIPPEKLANRCAVGENEPVTLGYLIEDYIRHTRHHLEQIWA